MARHDIQRAPEVLCVFSRHWDNSWALLCPAFFTWVLGGRGLNSGPILTTPHIFLLTLQPLRLFFPQETALFTSCIHVYICLYTHVGKYEFQHTCLSIHSIKFLKIYSLTILHVCVYFDPIHPQLPFYLPSLSHNFM